ncbi:MAG: nicotinate-nucleotide--dimethylbenzimidazole phosphoribosyltransferase [Myxococcota bacterium]|jgi:nicotinate-nucleotide--dimethylbenzimidazole phosphoribosyltransferase
MQPDPTVQDASARVRTLAAGIPSADDVVRAAAAAHLAALATPPGALGALGALGVQLAASTGQMPPPSLARARVIVCAGDHGVHAQGVSPWPQAITAMMATTVAAGRAGVSAIAAAVDAEVMVLDVGVADTLPVDTGVRDVRIVAGTRDASVEDAMTLDEAARAVLAGVAAAEEAIDAGVALLVLGDLGIANTTTSAALVAICTGRAPADVTGRGTGVDDPTLAHKVDVVGRIVQRVAAAPDGDGDGDGLTLLAQVGGAEHAALVGVVLAAAARRVPVLLDGVIADAAALVAVRLAPAARDHLVAGHRSTEPGATIAMDALKLSPLIDLDLRLGEGSGGVLAVPIVRAAARVLTDVVTLAELGAG